MADTITCRLCSSQCERTTRYLLCVRCLTKTCCVCGTPFTTGQPNNVTCSDSCYHRWSWIVDRANPKRVRTNRAVNARWCAAHRKPTVKPNPWLYGRLPYSSVLPGFRTTIQISPPPKTPPTPGTSYVLHGVLSRILERPHEGRHGDRDRTPNFVLVPRGTSWAVHWLHTDARRLAGEKHAFWRNEQGQFVPVTLYGEKREITLGPPEYVLAPDVERGRRMIRVTTITPLVYRGEQPGSWSQEMNGAKLIAALHLFGRRMLGIPREDLDRIRMEVHSITQKYEAVHMGDHFGSATGIMLDATIETNAVARWLFLAAQELGLGGRVSLGFGRIIVRT